ncbi:DHA2 family efflux MFS transporter permease subunit [Gluconacetobacter aggeris]|uniref:DHA2 family efflux MFS transporter permease subunit n=1 Tax=Gluconacetobacter aggeris TaxID=1286186 RepID=A0A7W4IQQ4_9PROT|nr:DHA2 family efflux MFS transporter permease subunit [Gluconacetobacter aggeris]MBB2167194.1 DHA2 family efflux MFS transporter permease subunit [Gluconacetobacter aggeris]
MSRVPETDAPASPGESDRLPPGIWKIASVAAIGSFMSQLDATIVNVSLPGLAGTLHATFPTIQWIMSGYLLALALTLPLNGWLVDRIGARALYLWCFAAFTLASGLCGLAWSAPSLIGFRVLQGMAGGLLAPMAQMLVARAAGRHMPRVASMVVMPVLLAPLLGPVVAGGILTFASWRWIFLFNLPVGLLAFVLAWHFLPDDRQQTRPRVLDLTGLALLSPALVFFLYGIDRLGQRMGGALACCGLLLFALYGAWAHRKGDGALIDLRLFGGRVFSASVITLFLLNGALFAGQMLVPVWLIHGCGLSPDRVGWLMTPMGLGMMCAYPLMGRLTDRFGIRKLTNCGALAAFAGTLLLVFLAQHGLAFSILAGALFLRGAGMGAIGIPSMSAGYAAVKREELPVATTALNIVQRLGGPIWTTLCAMALGGQASASPFMTSRVFVMGLGLLCVLHAVLLLTTRLLPVRLAGRGAGKAPGVSN